jgi:hypothetical protein
MQRERRLAFLEKFDPLSTVERVNVRRQEVEGFLWKDVTAATLYRSLVCHGGSFDVTYWPIASFRGNAALQSPLE